MSSNFRPNLGLLSLLFFSLLPACTFGQSCAWFNYCNGHGTCKGLTNECLCYDGWGSATDVATYKAPDCSQRVCPSGKAWADVPTGPGAAHALAECSNKGICDRVTGTCNCPEPFAGEACQRMKCPNDCSGHGQCLPMRRIATMSNAYPVSNPTTYTGDQWGTTWDEDMLYACVCDSSWPVGLGSGQVQESEWHGPDCSLRHCPSANDPRTADVDETNCHGKSPDFSTAVGLAGNKCHVDCANRGTCDLKRGKCSCFQGYYGDACNQMSALAEAARK